jgi:hypothetical protein
MWIPARHAHKCLPKGDHLLPAGSRWMMSSARLAMQERWTGMVTFAWLRFTGHPGRTICGWTYSFAATPWQSFILAVNGRILLKPETSGRK